MDLLLLAPDLQETLPFVPPSPGRRRINLLELRYVCQTRLFGGASAPLGRARRGCRYLRRERFLFHAIAPLRAITEVRSEVHVRAARRL